MDKSARIYVAGHRGLVGSALMQRLQAGGYTRQAGCPSAVSGRSRHTGRDGAYLAEFLLHKGHGVYGIKRRASLFNTDRIDHLYRGPHEAEVRVFLHPDKLNDWQLPHQELQ